MDKDEGAHVEENIASVKEGLGEQPTLWDREAMGEEKSEAQLDAEEHERIEAPDPEQVALKRAAASSIEVAPSAAPLH